MVYEIYVISNSDLFREGLNAVAAFCQSQGFKVAVWMGSAISILLTAFVYIKQHDLLVYLKWLVSYFVVSMILLGLPTRVAIINTSDPTVPPQVIDHVPFGLALPAHLITAFGYSFSSDLETVFSLPNEMQYHKTGMLFGSNLFRLSLASQLDDPEIMNQMNNYVRSCVVGDILINHKYTFNDLLHTEDLWGLITRQPSPIRGLFINGHFNTCAQAAKILTREINQYTGKTAPTVLAKFIPTQNRYSSIAVMSMLTNTYEYFKTQSKTATDILRQNIAINAFRAGIKNYATETGSIAGMENIANTTAMHNTRLAWATSQHIGIETLPLMQVVLLLLLLCIFPLIAVLAQIPGLGFNVFKNYLYSLLWLETWPILYTILNMAMNFYMHAGNHGAITLSSINLLAQEHSDIASIAGYLVLAIPFLSFGIVKGMAFTFNNAAQYLGGMMHSIAQGSASATATGNYSLGNISTDNATANNLNANKHDTNFTSYQGLSTQQLDNAATVTKTAMGQSIYNTSQGISQLATSAHAAENTAASLSQSVDHSVSSAYQSHTQYMKSKGHTDSLGDTATSGTNSQIEKAMSTIDNETNQVAKREHISKEDAFKKLCQKSFSGGLAFSMGFGIGEYRVGANVKTDFGGSTSSEHTNNYSTSADKSITSDQTHNFRSAVNTIKNYSQTHSLSDQNTDAENIAIQMGADLNKAERLSKSAQFIQSHSNAINTNFSQAYANYVETHRPQEAQAILSATGDSPLLAKQQALADQFIQTHAKQLASKYAADCAEVRQGFTSAENKYLMQNYHENSENLLSKGKGLGVDPSKVEQLSREVKSKIHQQQIQLSKNEKIHSETSEQLKVEVDKEIKFGKAAAKRGIIATPIDVPE